jgi:hypothetical protein
MLFFFAKTMYVRQQSNGALDRCVAAAAAVACPFLAALACVRGRLRAIR